MKLFFPLLAAVSLTANVLLLGALFAGRNAAPPVAIPAASATTAAAAPAAAPDPTATVGAVWQDMTGGDLAASVARLRELGLPPHILRAIVAARVNELFAPQFKALRPDANTAFWKNTTVDARMRTAEYQLYREQQKMLRDLLGADAENSDMNIFSRQRLETVPADKQQAVKDAVRMFEEKRQEIYSSALGMITPEMQRKAAALLPELQATLGGILTPTELEEYNLRNSDASQNLRMELSAFNASEDEFRAIYKIWSQLEQATPGLSQDEMQRRFEAQRKAKDQIKAMLGPQRGADYERSTDFSYRQTSQLVARLELPAETTTKVWEVKQDIEKRAGTVRMDRALSNDDRTKQLAALATEGTSRVAALVGNRGIEAYKTQGAGYWLQSLQPRPTTGTPTGTVLIRGP